MKRFQKYLPLAALGLGIAACLLRMWLFAMGTDDRGLLSAGSAPDILSWITVAVTMALLAIGIRKLGGAYEDNSDPSAVAALGTVLTAAAFCIATAMETGVAADSLQTAATVMGFVATAALLLLAWCRFIGSKPNVLLHTAVCIYLMLYLVSHYRLWSSYPQLQTYAFELLAIVFTMLASYQRAAFDGGMGNRRTYVFFSLAALFFSIATLPGSDNPVFFIGCAVWMFFTPCSLEPGEDGAEEINAYCDEAASPPSDKGGGENL